MPASETPVIRPAGFSDMQAICDMVHGLAAHHGDQAQLDLDTLLALTRGPHPTIRCLVATCDHGVIGYAALQSKVQLHSARKVMDLEHLFVLPDLRGQGVGAALINAAAQLSRDAGCHRLTVRTAPANDRAAKLYRAVGFEDRPPSGTYLFVEL